MNEQLRVDAPPAVYRASQRLERWVTGVNFVVGFVTFGWLFLVLMLAGDGDNVPDLWWVEPLVAGAWAAWAGWQKWTVSRWEIWDGTWNRHVLETHDAYYKLETEECRARAREVILKMYELKGLGLKSPKGKQEVEYQLEIRRKAVEELVDGEDEIKLAVEGENALDQGDVEELRTWHESMREVARRMNGETER